MNGSSYLPTCMLPTLKYVDELCKYLDVWTQVILVNGSNDTGFVVQSTALIVIMPMGRRRRHV